MRISCISDRGAKCELSEDLWGKARALMREKGHAVQEVELNGMTPRHARAVCAAGRSRQGNA